MDIATQDMPSKRDLMELAYRYYPRWYPARQTLDEYLEGYDSTPEFQALMSMVGHATRDNARWHGLLRDVKRTFPGDRIDDGRPPSWDIPSYQLVVEYEHPPGTKRIKLLVFRLSFFAPVFDFHETDRDENGQLVSRQLTPSPVSAARVAVIERKICQRFGYHKLDPGLGATPVLGIGINTLLPDTATLADALFEDDRRW